MLLMFIVIGIFLSDCDIVQVIYYICLFSSVAA